MPTSKFFLGRITTPEGVEEDLSYPGNGCQLKKGTRFSLRTPDGFVEYTATTDIILNTTGMVLESYPTQVELSSIQGEYA